MTYGAIVKAALVGGLAAGAIDICAASLIFHLDPGTVLQIVAGGLLGPVSYQGGAATMLLGAFLQGLISVVAALVYGLAAKRLPVLLDHPLWAGLLFGAAANLFLTFLVVPLSHAKAAAFGTYAFNANLAANTILFGPPIAFVMRWFARRA